MFLFIFDKYKQLDMLKKLPLIFNNDLIPIKVQHLVCIVLFFISFQIQSQTTIISPTGDGGFETGTTFALNGWTTNNPAQTTRNQWVCNTGATAGFSGTSSAYITNNATGIPPHAYATGAARASHFYRNVTVPGGETNIILSFSWIGQGESTFDRLRIWLVPTAYNPVYGTEITTIGTAPTGRIQIGLANYSLQGSWANVSFNLPTSYAGTTFRLVFEWANDGSLGTNPPAAVDNISLTSAAIVAPSNNNCSNATLVTTNPTATCTTSTSGTTIGATQSQVGCTGNADDDVWYSFIATGSTHAITVTPTTLTNAVFEVFSGSCGGLTSLNCVNLTTGSSTETITLSGLTATNTYYVRVYSNANGTDQGTFSICVTSPPPTPSNNLCTNATALPCATTNLAGTTVNTNNIVNNSGCSMADYGVWYTFVGDGNNSTISVTTTGYDIEMSISSGSCGSLTNITCQDSALSNGTETYTFSTILGVNYYVYVAHYLSGSTTTGTFTISRSCAVAPNPCVAIPNISSCGTTINATIPSGAGIYSPSSCGWTTPGNEQIYTFTPTQTGSYTISQLGSFGFIDYQFKAASLGCNGTGWTCIDDMSGAVTSSSFTLTSGIQYYILLDPETTTGGSVSFILNCPLTPPTNDDCLNAIPLTVNAVCSYATYTNAGATASSGAPAPGCSSYSGGDVWFTAVVPSNGILIIDTQTGVITDGGMEVYSGSCGTLTVLGCDDDSSLNGAMPNLTLTGLTPAQIVYIRVWEYGNNNNGTFGICVTSPIPPTNDECVTAETITVNPTITCTVSTTGTTLGATQSQAGCTGNADDDVWYQFVANDISHTVTITPNTLTNAVFQIFSGTCGSLISSACINNTTGTSVETTTLTGLTIGAIYTIRVYSNANGSGQGTFSICVTTPCTPGAGIGLSSMGCPTNVAGGLGLNGLDPSPILDCSTSTCTNLEATFLQLGQTTSYTVQSIPYAPPYQFGCLQNSVSINVDDVWSPTISLPFNFCYYGNTYNQCLIGSNGVITFDQTSNTPGGYSTWSFSNDLPSTSLFLNSIFGAYHDIDPSVGGEVGWELVTLSSGCRALVASWNEIPMFSASCNSLLYTGMIVLYENTNIIEVYMKEKRVCASWNSGNAVVGVQNATGSQATVAPNRNSTSTDWTITNEAWRFVPSGTSLTTITWYEGNGITGPVVGSTASINVCPTATTTYTARVTYTFCNGTTLDLTDTTTITINDRKTWNGSVDTDWNKANNWTPTGIPNGSDCVVIPITPNNPIVSGTNYNGLAGTLSVLNGATLTINSTNSVTVTDWVNVQATGSFIINNTASLVQINNTTNTGNITYRRTSNNIRSLDYVYWSSPVSNYNVNNIISPLIPGPIWRWNPIIANTNGGQGNWEVASGNTMLPAKGYIVRGPSSFSPTVPAPLNGTFVGTPNNGIINYTISRGSDQNTAYHQGINGTEITNFSDNWNLLGNPYPSAIRGSQFLFNNNTKIEGNIKLWTHGTLPSIIASPFYNSYLYNYSPGDYLTYNFTGTSCCPAAASDLFIGAGQGFFVQMIDGPAGSDIVTFNNGLRSASYDNSLFYRMSTPLTQTNSTFDVNALERNRIWLDLISSNNQSDRTLFGYIEGATMGRDSFFDSQTLKTGSMSIYSLINSDKFLIQGRQLPFDVYDEVPIGAHLQNSGSYDIGIGGLDGIFTTQNIYLKDKELDIIHDLKVSPYRFSAQSGTINNRFKIVYLNGSLNNNDLSLNNNIAVITNENIVIRSSNEKLHSITVFDVLGRNLGVYKDINSTEFTIKNLLKNNTALFLQIKLENGVLKNEKIIF
ncbi:hypothetical protein [Flavobacterium sp.]|uniref:hypothetical protein n=1 Tax=Flavobacterium sp. TaxID=239 RepID=UPI00263066B1|nr:hypothetical protein [Flavobacterium sp.]